MMQQTWCAAVDTVFIGGLLGGQVTCEAGLSVKLLLSVQHMALNFVIACVDL